MQIIPEGFIGVRFRIRSLIAGGIMDIRADSNDGPMLCSVVVPSTELVPDGEPQWQARTRVQEGCSLAL